ncbi:unnamed protein product [Prorocentrum cordatum]|uniref:Dynein heavy chain AAA lid domain-containing protein n=1 Tax=Prorocentrum cordatum TaxID=2364126 RepID=A0ABN9Q0I3_9DINO|nr:unnamed protein product [Polarella glacialis]
MYGGHITDFWDRRVNNTYLEMLITAELLATPPLQLCKGFRSPDPAKSEYSTYAKVIEDKFPQEAPELFSLHPNAEIGYLTNQGFSIFKTVQDRRLRRSAGGGREGGRGGEGGREGRGETGRKGRRCEVEGGGRMGEEGGEGREQGRGGGGGERWRGSRAWGVREARGAGGGGAARVVGWLSPCGACVRAATPRDPHKGALEGAKLFALRASRFGSDFSHFCSFSHGRRRESAQLFALRASRSAKREVGSPCHESDPRREGGLT